MTTPVSDGQLTADIVTAISRLHSVVHQAEKAGLHVRIVASANGLPITSRVFREYDFDLAKKGLVKP